MSGELATVKQAAFWAAGVVIGLLVISYVLRAVGVSANVSLSPEQLVSGGDG